MVKKKILQVKANYILVWVECFVREPLFIFSKAKVVTNFGKVPGLKRYMYREHVLA